MSWLMSVVIASLIYTSPSNFSIYSTENLVRGNTPQLVVLTPQTVLQGDETERFEKTYPLNSNGRISISNVNGSITIEAWDRNEVKLEAVKIADSKERLAEVEIKVDSKQDALTISTEYGTWKNGSRNWNCNKNCRLEVQYKLMVPQKAVLNEVETVNGSVSISNMTNVTNASAVNGSVKAMNLRGTARIETVNGTTEASFDSLNSNSKINLSTVNGQVNLLIPSDVDATIKADTVNGNISNEFGLPVRKGKYVGRDLYGKVGDGSVKINLDSVNGGLNIKRKQDGKSPKPVVNLLPSKVDDEDDEDAVTVAQSTNRSINRSVAQATRESTRIARESARVDMKEAMKIAELAPEIAAQALKDASKAMADNSKSIELAQREMERFNRDIARLNKDVFSQAFARNWGEFATSRVEEQSETIPVKGTPKVTVDAKNCSVSVKGWDRQEVKYRITKLVRGMMQPELGITVNRSESEVTIIANADKTTSKAPLPPNSKAPLPPNENEKTWTTALSVPFPANAVKIEVFVPKKSNLRILTQREIRVEGITGSIDLTGQDNAINVRDSEGKLKIVAGDAMIRVIGFTGEVDSKTADGTNFFEGVFEKFSAKVVDGKIVLTLPEDANVNLEANAKIHTEGFDLTEFKDDETRRQIGQGGPVYRFNINEGEILVRNSKLLNAKY